MELIVLKCHWCSKKVYRNRGRVNEAKQFGWKTYCSPECQKKSLTKSGKFTCTHVNCNKIFLRAPHDIRSASLYCSQSCAAKVNNSKYPKRVAVRSGCSYCHQQFKGKRPYCSGKCKNEAQTINATEIIKKIQEFYKKHGRIPVKIEFTSYGAAQDRFGSWNKAIVAAGFSPNPVMFARRYTANDGHECDSFAEKVIDDWLYKNRVPHKRRVPYPTKPVLTADFVIGNTWVEFFGLAGVLKNYDSIVEEKRMLAKKHKIKLIELYPKDLFPKNKLATLMAKVN